jgi:hypothetical protein
MSHVAGECCSSFLCGQRRWAFFRLVTAPE